MALRDWLNPDYDPLATAETAICSKSDLKITGITKSHAEITTLLINQSIENKVNIQNESQNHKNHSHKHSELKKQGMNRLEVAAQGLPVTRDELAVFFADDLQDFGSGEVKQAGIRQACEWYAYEYKGRAEPQPEEIPVGMVRCTDCLQDRCKYRYVTPYGTVVMQSSPAWRWCDDYTARVYNLNNYRKR